MSEQLYTIPVNEAFRAECECPVCFMWQSLSKTSIEFTLGPSYMEDDVRMETNRVGFCKTHVKELYRHQNRLGLALMMKTHMDKVIDEIDRNRDKKGVPGGLFKKQGETPLLAYIHRLETDCFVCERVSRLFTRYIATVFYLYEKESDFRELFSKGKGFCNDHYALLLTEASKQLFGRHQEEFIECLHRQFLDNMKRVRDDLDWFIDKFDYRNAEAPWKNSKDALQRAILKVNGVDVEKN